MSRRRLLSLEPALSLGRAGGKSLKSTGATWMSLPGLRMHSILLGEMRNREGVDISDNCGAAQWSESILSCNSAYHDLPHVCEKLAGKEVEFVFNKLLYFPLISGYVIKRSPCAFRLDVACRTDLYFLIYIHNIA